MTSDSILHIPAKTGSVRAPGKNWADVGGKPSIAWVIEAAIGSSRFSRIIVSTNSPEVRDAVLGYPVELVGQVPSTVIQTTHDVLAPEDYKARITIMLPTVALITQEDIKGALDESETDPVMIVTRFPYRTDEIVAVNKDGHVFRPFTHGPAWIHDNDPEYFIDAGALYTFPPNHFHHISEHYVPCLRPYIVPRYRGVDVDEPEDMELVRLLFYGGKVSGKL